MKKTQKYRQYSQDQIDVAIRAVSENRVSVYKASFLHGVPQSTIRDRLSGKVHQTKAGRTAVFSEEEESNLMDHIKYIASMGHVISRQQLQTIASEYAVHLGHRDKETCLSKTWITKFMERHPDIDISNGHGNMDVYFEKLLELMNVDDFGSHPERIYIIDPKRVCAQPSLDSPSHSLQVVCAANALGTVLKPFVVLRSDDTLLNVEIVRADIDGEFITRSTEFSDAEILKDYLTNHFVKSVNPENKFPTLVFYSGATEHLSIEIMNLAQENRVKLVPFPPSEAIAVECFIFFSDCLNQWFEFNQKDRPDEKFSMKEMCEMVCQSYHEAFTPENILPAFTSIGISLVQQSEQDLLPEETFVVMELDEETT